MTQINPNYLNINQRRQNKSDVPSFRAGNIPQNVYIPSYYVANNNHKASFKEQIESNPLLAMPYEMLVKPFVEHPMAIIPTWLGITLGLDAYSHACGGDYEKSLVKKAANLGDKIQGSKLIQNKPVQSLITGLGSIEKAGGKAELV